MYKRCFRISYIPITVPAGFVNLSFSFLIIVMQLNLEIKVKVKVSPRTGYESPWGE
jgi:hypothetical protein